MEADFSGYATRADIRCSDGRTITPDAFKHQDKIEVPLVWQHNHDNPNNVLGRAILEHRDVNHPDGAGIYCYGYFNDTEAGQTTRALVQHKDVKALSIYANGLVEKSKVVLHGAIREVSVVLSGANPGAFIDNIRLAHSDGEIETLDDEAIIYSGLEIHHSDEDFYFEHAEGDEEGEEEDDEGEDGETIKDVYDSFSKKQKDVVHYMIGAALEQADEKDDKDDDKDDAESGVKHSDNSDTYEGDLKHHQEGDDMPRNQFEHGNSDFGSTMTATGIDTSKRLSHSDLESIIKQAKQPGGSFKEAVMSHAATYGIDNIEMLFPDAKAIETTPQFISRRMEWVASVINGTKHSPLAAVKTLFADITKEEARAKGYTKGGRKEEEVFSLLGRSTRPATIYKKQKLDRDDLLDITDVSVVSWLKAEMRLMIEEELARAILVGDNRPANHPDKVKDPKGAVDGVGIRSVLHDDDLYAIKTELPSNVDSRSVVRGLVRAMDDYRGSGGATMYISRSALTDIMLEEDRFGRPLYANRGELADKVGVSKIEPIDIFTEYEGLFAIIVSLADYTVGSNRGGELTSFEDFDIDFNQYKYLQETRLSGGLTKPFSAIVVTRSEGTSATATAPSFDGETNTVTIPTVNGVVYTIDGVTVTGNKVITEPTEVRAEAADGYYLPTGTTRSWFFQV